MMFPKNKRVRLSGKALSQLNDAIHERDGHTCIIPGCGRSVASGEKFNHEPSGRGNKQDMIENGCLLCYVHHIERHDGKTSAKIQQQCEEYLTALYPEVWQQEF